MTQAKTREELVTQLAIEVTRSDKPPSEDLATALEQVVDEIQTGEAPARPLDWANAIAEAVADRHSAG